MTEKQGTRVIFLCAFVLMAAAPAMAATVSQRPTTGQSLLRDGTPSYPGTSVSSLNHVLMCTSWHPLQCDPIDGQAYAGTGLGMDFASVPGSITSQTIRVYGRGHFRIQCGSSALTVNAASNDWHTLTTSSTSNTVSLSVFDPDLSDGLVGWAGVFEVQRTVTYSTGGGFSDVDGDGVADGSDNCPSTSNPSQSDSDGDGIGDACDAGGGGGGGGGGGDRDGDGISDSSDNCPNVSNAAQADRDNDGVGNVCDNCRRIYNPTQRPGDACAQGADGNCTDGVDNDGDGWTDYPDDPGCASAQDSELNPNIECDDGFDNDGDGRVDAADPACPSPLQVNESPECQDGVDNDGDGWTDYPDDPECSAVWIDDELNGCSTGSPSMALFFLLPLFGSRRRRKPLRPSTTV